MPPQDGAPGAQVGQTGQLCARNSSLKRYSLGSWLQAKRFQDLRAQLVERQPGLGAGARGRRADPALIGQAVTNSVSEGAFVISMSLNGTSAGQAAVDQRKAMDLVRTQNRLFVQSVSNFVDENSFTGQITQNLVGTDLANKDWFLFGVRVDKSLQARLAPDCLARWRTGCSPSLLSMYRRSASRLRGSLICGS
jgi:hypothetical protein